MERVGHVYRCIVLFSRCHMGKLSPLLALAKWEVVALRLSLCGSPPITEEFKGRVCQTCSLSIPRVPVMTRSCPNNDGNAWSCAERRGRRSDARRLRTFPTPQVEQRRSDPHRGWDGGLLRRGAEELDEQSSLRRCYRLFTHVHPWWLVPPFSVLCL